MSEAFLGEIRIFGFNFAPYGWATCDGQILPLSQNTALFSLLGTQYGGDGRSTFALPDLRGRVPVAQGQGPGLSNYAIGGTGGVESVTLTTSELPPHTHQAMGSTADGNQYDPSGAVWAQDTAGGSQPYGSAVPNVLLAQTAIGITGGSQPHANLQPYLVANFCIAMVGIFPSRN
jgi:microcystin-dependent protein